MAIVFTDAQLREMTGQLVNSDAIVQGYQDAKSKAIQMRQDYLDLDDQEAVYTDNWLSIIEQFHTELKLLNSSQRTTYDPTNIDSSAKLSPGNAHFSDWEGYKPKVIPSNNGNPISTYSGHYEIDRLGRLIDWIGKIKNGFTGASVSGTGTSYTPGNIVVSSSVTAVAGQPIVAYKANAAVFGICTGSSVVSNPGPPPTSTTTITLNVLETYGTLTGPFQFTQSHDGFTDAVRKSTNNDGFLLMCKNILTSASNDYVAVLDQELVALDANDSKEGDDPTQIAEAKSSTNAIRDQVTSWLGISGQNRFGDTDINPYNGLLTNRRDTYIPNRVTEIQNSLGSVTQPNTETVEGTGRYRDLYTSLNIRLHKISGYRRNYYQSGMAVMAQQEQADVKIAEATRNKNFAEVKLLLEDPTGTNTIKVKDFGKLEVGDEVKVLDNAVEGVLNFTIQELIAPSTVVLSDVVPPKYTLGAQVRLVKIL